MFQPKQKRPENQSVILKIVDPQGFEPQMTEPKSVVLPLHHGSVHLSGANLIYFSIITSDLTEKIYF